MCFSAQADLVGGTVITLLGVDAIRHVRERRELPIAALPILLGTHQLIETFVWWGLQGHVADDVGQVATWIYLFIAFVVLPPYVPYAVREIESRPSRRRMMLPFLMLGAAVGLTLLVVLLRGPVTATLESYHLAYATSLAYGGFVVIAYVVATCGSLLLSSHRQVVIFGLVNLPVIVVLALLTTSGFASLWCAWAALASCGIAVHLRVRERRGRRVVVPAHS